MSEAVSVAILGATGRVGVRLVSLVLAHGSMELVAAIGRPGSPAVAGVTVGALQPGCFRGADVVVDFSTPEALCQALPLMGDAGLVSGTTGLSDAQHTLVDAHCAAAPVVLAANFSTGVNLLLDLVARAAAVLPDADIEIVEAHHHHKVDAPSGTALALGRAAAEARGVSLDDVAVHGREGRTGSRTAGSSGMHALRLGDVIGEHDVWLASDGDRVRLGHVATSRDTCAVGALRAAQWVRGRGPGRYTMRDVLGLS